MTKTLSDGDGATEQDESPGPPLATVPRGDRLENDHVETHKHRLPSV